MSSPVNGEWFVTFVTTFFTNRREPIWESQLKASAVIQPLEPWGQAPNIIIDATGQAGMTREIAENAAKRAFVKQTRDGNVRVQEVRIIGRDFDVTIPYDPTR